MSNVSLFEKRKALLSKPIECYTFVKVIQYGGEYPCEIDTECGWGMGIYAVDLETNKYIALETNFDSSD